MAAFTLLIAPLMLPVASMTNATSIGPQCCWVPPSDEPPPPDPPSGEPGPTGELTAPASTTESTAMPAHRALAQRLLSRPTFMVHPVGARHLQGSDAGRTSERLSSEARDQRPVSCSRRC